MPPNASNAPALDGVATAHYPESVKLRIGPPRPALLLRIRPIIRFLLFCGTAIPLIAQPTVAAEESGIVLVDAGRPKAVIVWDAKAADDPFFEELQPYFEDYLPWAIGNWAAIAILGLYGATKFTMAPRLREDETQAGS